MRIKRNERYGFWEFEENDMSVKCKNQNKERSNEIQDYILNQLGHNFEYKCIKKGLTDIVINSGLEASIRHDGEYRKCFYCDGSCIICKDYEPLIYLINLRKKRNE